MTEPSDGFTWIEDRLTHWAERRADIRIAFVLGSRARTDLPADQWSDLDIAMLVDDPTVYISGTAWPSEIGEVLLTFVESAGGTTERRVLFDGGYDVDFAVTPWSAVDLSDLLDPPLEIRNSLGRGFRVLVDREDILASIDRVGLVPAPPTPPSEAEYLYHVLWTARHIRHGELWWARSGLEGRLVQLMLPMMEWHSRFGVERGMDTWLRGRFLEKWAGADAVAALAGATSRYDAAEVAAALPRNHDLFRGMAKLVGEKLGYEYPDHADAEITRLTRDVLAS